MTDPQSDQLLDDLTVSQRRAVTSEATPLCILAGAGAGKTRVLTRRIARRVVTGSADPARVLALTFTRKAAGELSHRLVALGLRDQVQAGTFHAVAAAQLRRWWADRGQAAPTLLDRKGRLLAPLVDGRPGLAGVPLPEVAGHIEWAKARLVRPEDLPVALATAGRRPAVAAEELAAVYARYEHEKTRRGLVDFDDLLARCADAIDTDPTFAAAQRWRWRHVFVDEFQDVNPLQHRLLLAWLGSSLDLCVVGDPNQAIYGWNGADPELLAALPHRWPSAEVVRLDANHRSTPQIVAAAAAVLGADAGEVRSTRPDGPAVAVRSWSSGEAEAQGVAAGVRAAHARGGRWRDLAVLARTNAQALVLADALRAASVPVRTPGAGALLDHPTVRAALTELRRAPAAPVATAAADLRAWAETGAVTAPDATPDPRGGPPSATNRDPGDDPAGALVALADLARQAGHAEPATTIGAWIRYLPVELGRDPAGPEADAVTVCSFHRAKGLEWSEVWACGLEVGLVPIGHAQSAPARAEERRLLYVALTRPSQRLHCSWAETRAFGARAVPREPSPWLASIPRAPAPADDDAADDPDRWPRRLAEQRDRLRADGRRRVTDRLPAGWAPPDDEVLGRLRAWRAETARASAVPAHVVLHDTIVVALASLRPHDHAGLLRVPGLGPVKADRFGEALLDLVSPHAIPA